MVYTNLERVVKEADARNETLSIIGKELVPHQLIF